MRKVEVTTAIRTTPERVIAAFTDPRMLREWWGVERCIIDTCKGGLYTLAWRVTADSIGFVSTGVIRDFHPASTLAVENFVYLNPERQFLGPMTLTVKATAGDGATRMYICQDGYRTGDDWDWYYDAVKNAWPQVAETIREYLEKDGAHPS